MSQKIYISRKCEYCHELLILLHKNKNILKFPVIDVHSNAYPTIVTSVPCMVVDDKILPGDELFKFLDYLIQKNTKEVVKENDLMPDESKGFNKPLSNTQGPSLNQSSQQRNLNIPGNTNSEVKDTMNGMINPNNTMMPDKGLPNGPNDAQNDEELLPGFCVGGVCELGFSSLEDEKDISMDNIFEMLDSSDITPQMDEGNTKSEKAKGMDDDYSRMIQERGNDMGMKSN